MNEGKSKNRSNPNSSSRENLAKGEEYGKGFKILIISIIIVQVILYGIVFISSSSNFSNVILLVILGAYTFTVVLFPALLYLPIFYLNFIVHLDKNIESLRKFIILYFLYVTFIPILYFTFDIWNQFNDIEYRESFTFTYNVFVTFYVIGLTSFILAFAKPMALKYSGAFREAGVLNKLVPESTSSFALQTDYIKIICSFVSVVSFMIVLSVLFIYLAPSRFILTTVTSLIMFLISLGMGVSNLLNSFGEKE
jgi:hypothetical protein